MSKIRLTAAQAIVRYLRAQRTEIDRREVPICAGVFAIFGHGNVAGLGHALEETRDLPTYRAHNEQAMGHIAVAFAKASRRRRFMACTTSIGPGATNLVTAAATAHVNRIPVLLLPGDVFASRAPDPVLQQLEDFGDPNITANDCLRPVSRWFDRIQRPEQLLASLPRALEVLTDPVDAGPVTLALPQDVQTEAFDFPAELFAPRTWRMRRVRPDEDELRIAAETIRSARRPLIIAGGGVLYSEAISALDAFASTHGVPVSETQAGKGALPWRHELDLGGIGVTGTAASNALAREADVVIGIGTRLQDFTTASRTLFEHANVRFVSINAGRFDAHKHGAIPLIGDARAALEELSRALGGWRADEAWTARAKEEKRRWDEAIDRATAPDDRIPSDAQVLGAVNRFATEKSVVVCAAGGLPGELHKLWRPSGPGSYHLEYGYSCMGYEIAGGLGVKIADPDREVIVMVGDGSYLMLNSELATSVMMDRKILVVLLDNHGFGCIHRLQRATGGAPFNNLLEGAPTKIDFVSHARALGAEAEKVASLAELGPALERARAANKTSVVVIETDPSRSTQEGGAWWEVAVPEETPREEVRAARRSLEAMRKQRTL